MISTLYRCPGWRVASSYTTEKEVKIKLVLDERYNFSCPKCHTRLIKHSVREINARDLPILEHAVYLTAQTYQGSCPGCYHFSTFRPTIIHPTMGYTWRLMKEVSKRFIHETVDSLSESLLISRNAVTRIDKEILTRSLPPPQLNDVEGILVDEKYLGSSKGFVTLVLNARTGEPISMTQGRNKQSLDDFIEQLNEHQKFSIEFAGIDRSNSYKAAINSNMPHTHICFDPFHLVSNINGVIDQIRRQELKGAPESLKQRLKGMRYILLKAPKKLDEDGKERLDMLLRYNTKLNKAYILKEDFRAIFTQDSINGFILALITWIKMAVSSNVAPMVRFAKSISSSFNEIVNSKRYGITSALIESANAGIKRIQSKTCGLLNPEYLFLKMRQIFNSRQRRISQQK